jgi:hypothetical protein
MAVIKVMEVMEARNQIGPSITFITSITGRPLAALAIFMIYLP